MKRALPGAFTFILNANNHVPKLFKNKKKTVGIRVPNHNIPKLIVELLGRPILSTSILIDDDKPEFSTYPEFMYQKYHKMVDCIIDSGNGGLETSTVVDCTNQEINIMRKGKGDLEQFH
jgi:tRNA threonylcarbamoyl adenosine modification protein (Sua5/YciO/YrdC/YwlC family)